MKELVTGLEPGKQYHYRVVGENAFGRVVGARRGRSADLHGPVDAEPRPGADAIAGPRPRPVARPGPIARPGPLARPRPIARPRPVARPDPVARPGPVARPEPVARPDPSPRPGPALATLVLPDLAARLRPAGSAVHAARLRRQPTDRRRRHAPHAHHHPPPHGQTLGARATATITQDLSPDRQARALPGHGGNRQASGAGALGGPERSTIVVSVSAAPWRRRSVRRSRSSSAVSRHATRSW